MGLFFSDKNCQIFSGDCRGILKELEKESVNCIVSSPPFWGLRRYAGPQEQVWDSMITQCEHQWQEAPPRRPRNKSDIKDIYSKQATVEGSAYKASGGDFCSICGAWRGALGLEPTPELYVKHLIEILELMRKVLRKDGVVFINLDDTRASSPPGNKELLSTFPQSGDETWWEGGKPKKSHMTRASFKHTVIKPKDLCLIPERFVIACQEVGWYVRSTIIWVAPDAMPESVQDRCTDSYQRIFMLTKSPKYWYDQEAVREPHISKPKFGDRNGSLVPHQKQFGRPELGGQVRPGHDIHYCYSPTGRNLRNVWQFPTQGFSLRMCQKCKAIYEPSAYQNLPETTQYYSKGRVDPKWKEYRADHPKSIQVRRTTEARERPLEPPHHSYRGNGWEQQEIEGRGQELKVKVCHCGSTDWVSHFAVFPRELVRRCVLAACPPKTCPKCRKPWVRVLEKKPSTMNIRVRDAKRGVATSEEGYKASNKEIVEYGQELLGYTKTLGWRPSCKCDLSEDSIPGVVFDPFMGSGTTLAIARELGRQSIGIDISEDYCRLASYRIERTQVPLFPISEETINE